MLEMRPDCELCGRDLPPDADGALICSFECTFCAICAPPRCPNCGGGLSPRPTRAGQRLEAYPAATERRFKG
jgi:uncharacterized protein